MKRRTCLLALAAFAVAAFAVSAPAEESKAKQPELKTVRIVQGGTGQAAQPVGQDFQAVVRDAQKQFPKANCEIAGETLVIRLPGEKEEPLADIELQSDCPNNSQFHVEEGAGGLAKLETQIEAILTTWTKARHNDEKATLLGVFKTELEGGASNFDIRLKLSKTAAAGRPSRNLVRK